jgi:L-ascorbate metabolism protein UlaG (beta-lactamase superfamily)
MAWASSGVNGYQFETGNHALLVDPYFTRIGFWPVVLSQPVASDRQRVDEGFSHLLKPADAVLVTHAHFDHLLDVPAVMERTGAKLISDEQLGVRQRADRGFTRPVSIQGFAGDQPSAALLLRDLALI